MRVAFCPGRFRGAPGTIRRNEGRVLRSSTRPTNSSVKTVSIQVPALECQPMQLWFSRASAVTLREQLVTQIILGILSGDLPSGQRLPSTRELARRFRLHPNTVSAGYRQLQRDRWVEFRRGSGVYVRDARPEESLSSAFALDQLMSNLFRSARSLNIPLARVRSRLHQWLKLQPPDHFLLIEPDEELRRILALELQSGVKLSVKSCSPQDLQLPHEIESAIPVALPNTAKLVRQRLPEGTDVVVLQVRSVPGSLAGWLPAPPGALVGIASRWPGFLKVARTVLIAAGFYSDGLVFRDARKPNWQRGLKETAAIICDSATAPGLPKNSRVVQFPLLSEASLAELQRYEDFIHNPLIPQS